MEKSGDKYIKKSITKVKEITPKVLREFNGLIHTNEGPVELKLGGYIATDINEVDYWVISAISFKENKKVIGEENEYLLVKSKKPVTAQKMKEDFEVTVSNTTQIGRLGDYLVFNGYAFWIVNGEIFERDYEPLKHRSVS